MAIRSDKENIVFDIELEIYSHNIFIYNAL